MRVKYINEKFTEDSDPIKDMGIGNPFYNLKPGNILEVVNDVDYHLLTHDINFKHDINLGIGSSGLVRKIWIGNSWMKIRGYFFNGGITPKDIRNISIKSKLKIHYTPSIIKLPLHMWPKYFKIIKNPINEKFTQDSDPIKDLGIGRLRRNRDFNSIEELGKELYSIIEIIIDPENKLNLNWNTKEKKIKNLDKLLNTKDWHNKLMDFKIEKNWTVNGAPTEYWNHAFRSFFYKKWHRRINYINEKFTEDSDPIKDMGIGQRALIKKWFKTIIEYVPSYIIDKNLNIIVYGDLSLRHELTTYLLDNLIIKGHLFLHDSKITFLPKNLKVHGNLYLYRCAVTELPDDLEVRGSIDLEQSAITKLPENLKIGGILDLRRTKITKLSQIPKNLHAKEIRFTDSKGNIKKYIYE